jgi:RNase P subunit RPR2
MAATAKKGGQNRYESREQGRMDVIVKICPICDKRVVENDPGGPMVYLACSSCNLIVGYYYKKRRAKPL